MAMPPVRPVASQDSTVTAILAEGQRPGKVPLRSDFVQQGERGAPSPGPLAAIVRRGRVRALDLYLLLVAWASAEPYNVRRDSRIWARALGLGTSDAARAAVSRNWAFLSELKLVEVKRRMRLADVRLLREDGSGADYGGHPGGDRNPEYLTIPFEYWTDGWYRTLSIAGKAMLLISRDLQDDFPLPADRAMEWYGISESTARRGFRELRENDLISVRKEYKEAPLAPKGYTAVNFHTLKPPFGPKVNETVGEGVTRF
jgi:hypothetical protein